mmetsp:Transcript_8400/g.14135  ORF Transcript_8400/g.14135 Transcript_8400/m.14135 type:complete len:218 (-) Transcript_8400:158-811(-)
MCLTECATLLKELEPLATLALAAQCVERLLRLLHLGCREHKPQVHLCAHDWDCSRGLKLPNHLQGLLFCRAVCIRREVKRLAHATLDGRQWVRQLRLRVEAHIRHARGNIFNNAIKLHLPLLLGHLKFTFIEDLHTYVVLFICAKCLDQILALGQNAPVYIGKYRVHLKHLVDIRLHFVAPSNNCVFVTRNLKALSKALIPDHTNIREPFLPNWNET